MAGIFRRVTERFFILGNVVTAISFLIGCYASWFDPHRFWFLGLFTLASLFLLLILVLFILFWLFAKKKYMLISIVTLAAAWVPLHHIINLNFPVHFKVSKQKEALRVMSWNIEHFRIHEHKTHPEIKAQMLSLINKYQPDVACFQEMVGGDFDSTAINYVPYIAESLGYKNYFYSYDKRDDFDDKHHYGIIIFSRYPILEKHTIQYEPHNYNSTFQYIDILKGADTVRVFNAHMQSLKLSDSSRQYIEDPTKELDLQKSRTVISKLKTGFLKRKLQSERIKRAMDQSPHPVIVCGDFNDVPNSYAYNTIGKGLNNAFAEKGSGIGRTFAVISPTLRIDNIFADKKFKVTQFVRIKKRLVDHFPIIADLEFQLSKP